MEEKLTKNTQLRNNEYYRMQQEYDYLYAQSKNGRKFNHLIERIIKPNNIRLAYRNIKQNKGSKAKGVSGKNMSWIAKLRLETYIKIVTNGIDNYIPGKIRRKEIPKSNGKVRILGIKEPIDKIIEQSIYQILDPIVTAKFHNNSNGFIKKRSPSRAISQLINIIKKDKLYFAISLDIKACFDNICHGKLLKQLWTLGIKDKNLMSLISKMLKAEVYNVGVPDKGTPQGGVLSPLLANVALNEVDWWLDSKQNKGVKFVRYADDITILCKDYWTAKQMLEKTKIFLNKRLKLEVSEDKTKIINLKSNYMEFLGIKIKIKKKKGKYHIVSHVRDKSIKKCEQKAKKQIRNIKRVINNPKQLSKEVYKYNIMVMGMHNYYQIANGINYDFRHIEWIIYRYIFFNFKDVTYSADIKSALIKRRYATDGVIPIIRGNPIVPIGRIHYKYEMVAFTTNNEFYVESERKNFHKEIELENDFVIDKLLNIPMYDKTVEFNDNVISKFCGQYGKEAITDNLIFDLSKIKIIRKNERKLSDTYNNIIIVNNKTAKLIELERADDMIEMERLKRNFTIKQIEKINKIRKVNKKLPI